MTQIYRSIAVILLLLSLQCIAKGQVAIKGHVYGEKEALASATVVLKDSTKQIVKYDITDSAGTYLLGEIQYEGLAVLHIRFLGYKEVIDTLFIKDNEVIIKNYTLKDTTITLDELTVKANPFEPIIQQGDTTTYNVSAFIDGTEDVIEDIIKKLPGFRVSDSGDIYYKGKEITKVLYEGGDLFGRSYKVSTQNIRANIIAKVNVIENYIENEILKGLIDSDKTVLNIELKEKFLFIPSGELSVEYGYEDYYATSSNLIFMGEALQNFTTVNYNTIGDKGVLGRTNVLQSEGILPQNPAEIIPGIPIGVDHPSFSLGNNRINNNSSFSGSFNTLLSLKEDLKIRLNYSLLLARNKYNTFSKTTYLLNENSFLLRENRVFTHRPFKQFGQLFVDYNTSENGKLRLSNIFKMSDISSVNIIDTENEDFTANYKPDEFFFSPNLEYTHRITSKTALQINTSYLYSDNALNYNIIKNDNPFRSAIQKANSTFNYFQASVQYLLNQDPSIFTIAGKYKSYDWLFHSNLQSQNFFEDLSLEDSKNSINTFNKVISLNGSYNYKLNGWELRTEIGLVKKTITTLNENKSNKIFYFNPKVVINRKLFGRKDNLTFYYQFYKNFPTINVIYPSYVLLNYRILGKGFTELSAISTHVLGGTFSYSDIFDKLLTAKIAFFYTHHNKSIGQRIIYSPSYTTTGRFFAPGNENYILSIHAEKYINPLSGTIILGNNFSWVNYYNSINNSNIINNSFFSSQYSFIFRTGWNIPLNFEVGISYSRSKYNTDNIKPIYYSRLHPSFKILFETNSNFLISINGDAFKNYSSAKSSSEALYFIDFNIEYNLLYDKLSFSLTGTNLLNNKKFITRTVAQSFARMKTLRVIPRYFLFGINFKF